MHDSAQDLLNAVREQANRLLREQVQAETIESLLDTPGSWDQSLWQRVAEQGWAAVALDEAHGGTDLGCAGLAVMAEEIGRAGAALPLWQNALAALALQDTGTAGGEYAPGPLLDDLACGRVTACLAWPGPAAGVLGGTDALSEEAGRLTGHVRTVAFGATADCALAIARDEAFHDSLWLVPLSTPLVTREVVTTIDNARGHATLRFFSAPAIRLGGAAAVALLVDRAAAMTAFEQVGSAQAGLARSIDFAQQREAFGQPIARFQAIKHKLVEIYSGIEIARGCALTALDLLDAPDATDAAERRQAVAAARVAASQADELAARDSINIFGALGVTREAAPHRHYRRARSLALELGSTAAWREALVDTFLNRQAGLKAPHGQQ
ncbi:MAG: hypothetical protein RL260_456 [Pseudomonadota bacterium]